MDLLLLLIVSRLDIAATVVLPMDSRMERRSMDKEVLLGVEVLWSVGEENPVTHTAGKNERDTTHRDEDMPNILFLL